MKLILRVRYHTAAVAACLITATSCGIGSTDPIEVGQPAAGIQQPGAAANTIRLFFASPDGIRGVSRHSEHPMGPEKALQILLRGPTKAETRRGLSTHLPPSKRAFAVTVERGTVDVHLPPTIAFGDLDVTAVSQVACTAANADTPGDDTPTTQVEVRLHESDKHPEDAWTIRCDSNGHARPVDSDQETEEH